MNKELKDLADAWADISKKLRGRCIEYLEKTLRKNGNEINWMEVYIPEYVSVSYDGGNHPEYASNAFSTVYAIKLDTDGKIYLHIEDCDEYPLSNLTVKELYNVCDFMYSYQEEIGFV